MPRLAAVLAFCLCLALAAGPAARPALALGKTPLAQTPTPGEHLMGSTISYIAGGVPPLIIAVLAISYGWTVPLLIAFAAGGAAYSLLVPSENSRADRIPASLRATSGAAKGLVFFPAMMALAGKNVYGPFLAQEIHDLRSRS